MISNYIVVSTKLRYENSEPLHTWGNRWCHSLEFFTRSGFSCVPLRISRKFFVLSRRYSLYCIRNQKHKKRARYSLERAIRPRSRYKTIVVASLIRQPWRLTSVVCLCRVRHSQCAILIPICVVSSKHIFRQETIYSLI